MGDMSRKYCAFAAFAFFVLIVSRASVEAQGLTGSVDGTVRDETSASIPGVVVTIASDRLIGGPRTAVTQTDGTFRFRVLPPGEYVVSFELSGFQKVERTGVIVAPDRTATLDQTLKPATVAETLTVVGESPVIDIRNTQVATTVDTTIIEQIPVARRFTDLLNVMPGVQNGLYTFSPANVVYGSKVTDNLYTVDGVNFGDPQVSSAITDIPYDDIQEVQVSTSGQFAEFGSASGGAFNFITKSGSDHFKGLLSGYVQTKGLTAKNVSSDLAAVGIRPTLFPHIYDGGGNLGGPVVRDRLWFFGSFYRFDQEQSLSDFPAPIPTTQWLRTFKLDGRLGDKQRWGVYHTYRDREWVPFNFGFTTAADPRTWVGIEWNNWLTGMNWTYTPNSTTVVQVRGGIVLFDLINKEPNAVPGTPVYVEQSNGVISGGPTQTAGVAQRDRREIRADVSHYVPKLFGGSHEFKVGFAYEGLPLDTEGRDQGHFNDTRLQLLNGAPYRVQLLNVEGHNLTNTNHASAFAQDQWSISPKITLNAGIRYDYWTSSLGPDVLTGGTWFSPEQTQKQSGILGLHNIAPRVGLAWDPTASRRWVVKAGWGRFYQRVDGTTISFARQIRNGTLTYDWIDRNGDRLYQRGEEGTLRSDTRPVPGSVDPNLKMPYTDSYNVSVEYELGRGFGVSASGVFKRERDLWSRVDLNKPFDAGYDRVQVVNPLDNSMMTIFSIKPEFQALPPRLLLTNPSSPQKLFRDYNGLELVLRRRLVNRWGMQASYNLGRSFGSSGTLFFDHQGSPYLNPNSLINIEGDQQLDRRHIVKLLGQYQLPFGLQVSGRYEFLSGIPLTTTFSGGAGVTGAQYGRFTQALYPGIRTSAFLDIPIQQQGTERFDSQQFLDLRVDKRTKLWRSTTFDVIVDLFNVFNANKITRVQTLNGALPNYLRPAEIMNPRAARVAARLSF